MQIMNEECKHVHYNTYIPSDDEWQTMLKEANEFDMQTVETFETNPEYLKWFNSRPECVKNAMKAKPREYFYTDPETEKSIYRVYGVIENFHGDNTCSYHIAEAGFMRFRENILKADQLMRIERWHDDHLSKIRSSGWCDFFTHPNGWVNIALILSTETDTQV